jgi:serpin B
MSRKALFKGISFLLVVFLCVLFLQCSKTPVGNKSEVPEEPIPDLPSVEKKLVESDNKFGLKFFKEVLKEENDKNVFISPLSVAMALGMTYNGAAGETQEAMQRTLELEGFTLEEVNQCYQHLIESLTQLDPKVQFQIANSIWYRLGLTPRERFLNLCQKYFKALVRDLDFSHPNAGDTINAWVNDNTEGKIKEIVSQPINPYFVMFLINAIYFKGTWTYEFDKDQTKDRWFYLTDGSKTLCKMMEQRAEFDYLENDPFQAIDLPYGNGDFSMTIFLPAYGTNIDSLIEQFDQDNLDYWISCFESDSVDLYFPRFKLEYELGLNNALTALGMGIAFSGADFSMMFENLDVFISQVKHKTFVEVNEEGTEAAAVTSVTMATSADNPSTRLVMLINRPFVFMIRENVSGTILFIGKIVDPGFE